MTLADGIAVKYPGRITGPLVERWVDEIVTVDEDSIADAMRAADGSGQVVRRRSRCGRRRSTDVRRGHSRRDRERPCVVISGGNVDLGVVPSLIRRHENQAGRRLAIAARIADRPGGLARLLSVFADGGADLIEVEHIREGLTCTFARVASTPRSRCAAPITPSACSIRLGSPATTSPRAGSDRLTGSSTYWSVGWQP